MAVRFSIILVFVFGAYAFLVFHLYDLQVVQGDRYVARADSQASGVDWQVARRGNIFFTDKNGNALQVATVKDIPFIYAVTKDVDDISEATHSLAPVLQESPDDLTPLLKKKGTVVLEKQSTPELASEVESLALKGIYTNVKPTRFYPFESLAAHLLGFVSPDSEGIGESGRYGVEKFYDENLKGNASSGSKVLDPGEDLYLTIEPNIQKELERILADTVQKFEAVGGLAMVEDPRTGKILALAGEPTFNPNNYKDNDLSTFLNSATQKLYEPGSIFKVLTMAAGIDAGKITPNTTYVDTGKIVMNNRPISNWDYQEHGAWGRITMTNVIEHSVNTGAIFAEKTTGHKVFTEYIKKFGLGEKTGVELPGELAGNLNRLNPGKEPDVAFATASYGQGVAVTPIELLSAIGAIANHGVLMKPYINANHTSTVVRRVITEETAQKVTDMMVSAVKVNKVADIPGYSIAAKTGTAFIPDFVHGGYTTQVFNTYIGYGPAYNPQFMILFRLEKPKGAPLAGTSVVPAFREMAQFLINYLEILPDRPEKTQKP